MKKNLFYIIIFCLLSWSNLMAQEVIDTIPATDSSFVHLLSGKLVNTKKMKPELRDEIENRAKYNLQVLSKNLSHLWTPYSKEEKDSISLENRLRFKRTIEKDIWHLFIADADKSYHKTDAYYIVENGYYEKDGTQVKATNPEWYENSTGKYWVQHIVADILRLPACIELTSVGNQTPRPRPIRTYTTNIINLVVRRDVYKSVDYNVPDAGINIQHNLHQVDDNLWEGTIEYYQDFRGVRHEGGFYGDRTSRTIKFYVSVLRNPDGSAYIDVRFGDIKATATERLR